MTARQKSDAATEETINTDGFSDMDSDDDVVPRNVIENTETGGFSFSSPEPVIAEPGDIAEANEEEPLSTTTVDEGETAIDEATDEEGTEGADVPDDAPDVPGDDQRGYVHRRHAGYRTDAAADQLRRIVGGYHFRHAWAGIRRLCPTTKPEP